jgi:hypothetical protein
MGGVINSFDAGTRNECSASINDGSFECPGGCLGKSDAGGADDYCETKEHLRQGLEHKHLLFVLKVRIQDFHRGDQPMFSLSNDCSFCIYVQFFKGTRIT